MEGVFDLHVKGHIILVENEIWAAGSKSPIGDD